MDVVDCDSISQGDCIIGIVPCFLFTAVFHVIFILRDSPTNLTKGQYLHLFPTSVYITMMADTLIVSSSYAAQICATMLEISVFFFAIFAHLIFTNNTTAIVRHKWVVVCVALMSTVTNRISAQTEVLANFPKLILMIYALPDSIISIGCVIASLTLSGPVQYFCVKCQWVKYGGIIAFEIEKLFFLFHEERHGQILHVITNVSESLTRSRSLSNPRSSSKSLSVVRSSASKSPYLQRLSYIQNETQVNTSVSIQSTSTSSTEMRRKRTIERVYEEKVLNNRGSIFFE